MKSSSLIRLPPDQALSHVAIRREERSGSPRFAQCLVCFIVTLVLGLLWMVWNTTQYLSVSSASSSSWAAFASIVSLVGGMDLPLPEPLRARAGSLAG